MQAEAMAAMRRRVVISSTIGNALEWFDFTVFGLFAGVLSQLFFPADDPRSSLLLIFATFGIAFAARPIGGLVFGLYADRHGRKRALVVMIMLMAVGTGLLGILPTYGAIGIAAPLLLLLARLIQGFSAGGEFGSASAMLIEFAPSKVIWPPVWRSTRPLLKTICEPIWKVSEPPEAITSVPPFILSVTPLPMEPNPAMVREPPGWRSMTQLEQLKLIPIRGFGMDESTTIVLEFVVFEAESPGAQPG
jgi:hypothetical protein